MFSPKKALLSAALCAALTAPTLASYNPDENTSTNSTSLAAPAPTGNLGEIAAQLRASIDANPARTILAPWAEILGENAPLENLVLAQQMLLPENLEKLGQEKLLERLAGRDDKVKTLALGASAAQLFTGIMFRQNQCSIIAAALNSSWPVSEYAALGAVCQKHLFVEGMSEYEKTCTIEAAFSRPLPLSEIAARGTTCKENLFTEKMDSWDKTRIIVDALKSSRPVSSYAALGVACKKFLFTEGMNGAHQTLITKYILPLDYDTQLAQLVHECAARPLDDAASRRDFIYKRAMLLGAGK